VNRDDYHNLLSKLFRVRNFVNTLSVASVSDVFSKNGRNNLCRLFHLATVVSQILCSGNP
jgi:hypothetical protein